MAIKEKKGNAGRIRYGEKTIGNSGARRCFLTELHVEASCDNPLRPSAG